MSKSSGEIPSWNFSRKAADTEAPTPVESGMRRRKATDQRKFTIGLDFGTSTTKCCFSNETGDRRFVALAHDTMGTDYSPMLFPSTIGLEGDRLVFGYHAEASADAIKIRSFKTCMLCQAASRSITCTCNKLRPGHYQLGGCHLSAEDLATLYLANVLKSARQRIQSYSEECTDALRIHVNSAGPLDQLTEFGQVGALFDRALFYAWRLADQSDQEWRLPHAVDALAAARQEPVPHRSHSPTVVYPETHAAMTAYLELPESEKGLYGLVDVGAGTTDVAFFWLQKDERETKAWYYAASSRRVGMDDIDHALKSVLVAPDGNLRRERERMSNRVIGQYSRHIKPVCRMVYGHQEGVLKCAMELDAREWAWCDESVAGYKLLLVGGGAAFEPVANELTAKPAIGQRWRELPDVLRQLPDGTLASLPNGNTMRLRDFDHGVAEPLMMLGYGLAHPGQDLVGYERDREGCKPPRRDGPDVNAAAWFEEQSKTGGYDY